MFIREHQSSGCRRWYKYSYSCVLIVILHLQHPPSRTNAWSPLWMVVRRGARQRAAVANNNPKTTICGKAADHAALLRCAGASFSRGDEQPRDGEGDNNYGERNENEGGGTFAATTHQHFLLDSASLGFYHHDERRPIRHPTTKPAAKFGATQTGTKPCSGDGRNTVVPDVVRDPSPPAFPSTIDALTERAAQQILRVLYSDENRDTARIGLQIEGLQYLQRSSSSSSNVHGRHGSSSEYAAMRSMAILLAGELSSSALHSSSSAPSLQNCNEQDSSLNANTPMPISIYWNTVKQALVASQELLFLKRVEKHQQNENKSHSSVYDRIQIRCLRGDHPMIPPDMLLHDRSQRRQRLKHAKSQMRRQHGLILVVQPTDYNDEYEPPGPVIGAWTALQELVASAAVEDLPVVCLSPRYRPGKNPAPWVLRDFAPPVLSWTVRMDGQVAVWHSPTTSTSISEIPSSSSSLNSRWHVFAVNNSDQTQSFPYLASCRDAPSDQKLRHLVNEHRVP